MKVWLWTILCFPSNKPWIAMKTFCVIWTRIGFLIPLIPKICCTWVVSTPPYAHDPNQSQSSPPLPRTYFEATSVWSFADNWSRRASGSDGGIYKPNPRGTEDSVYCKLSLCIPWRHYAAIGLIHPGVNLWCSVFDRINLKNYRLVIS